jgi:hypothetical protein
MMLQMMLLLRARWRKSIRCINDLLVRDFAEFDGWFLRWSFSRSASALLSFRFCYISLRYRSSIIQNVLEG